MSTTDTILMIGEGKFELIRCGTIPDVSAEANMWLAEYLKAGGDYAKIREGLRHFGVTHMLFNGGQLRGLQQLVAAGVPAAALADPRNLRTHPQLAARGFYEEQDHPVVGRHPISTLPYRFASVKQWLRTPSPTLGQHNREVFAEIGRSPEQLDALEAAGLIGQTPKGV